MTTLTILILKKIKNGWSLGFNPHPSIGKRLLAVDSNVGMIQVLNQNFSNKIVVLECRVYTRQRK